MKNVRLHIDGMHLDYDSAHAVAETLADQMMASSMCVAWYDGQKQQEHPAVSECQHKPGWLAYAEGHGGSLKIDLNGGEFIFVFAEIER